jgi:pimeloyl-ACP methyl ester carboxylesterase
MPFAELNGARVFYTDDGPRAATPVLLLHGLASDSHDWIWQLPALSERYRVIAPDLVGHGRSTARPGHYGLLDLADDAAKLLEQLGCRPAVVIGHSLGGVIANALAVERPELVASIVGIDAGLELPTPDLAAARANEQRVLGAEGVTPFLKYSGATVLDEPEWFRTWRMRRMVATEPHVVAGCYMALKDDPGGTPWMEYLARRHGPVLALHRSAEHAALDDAMFVHPMSRTEIWAHCGHWFHQQFPDTVNEILIDWIERTAALSTSTPRVK